MATSEKTNARNAVRFILDGKCIELTDVDPTRTVLQYLREDLRRTGTKEGCAEGDCGACTVVVAELNREGDDVFVKAINSCIQFLPTLDGKELITVESLAGPDGALHPVQQAMVECHGSQCGFCTPGFVMSLFALYKNAARPTREDVDHALSGNLCRCTGYRPIIDAATRMADHEFDDDWLRQPYGESRPPTERIRNLQAIGDDAPLAIQVGDRTFHAPKTRAECSTLLDQYPDATILAGGTDVGLWVTKQHRELTHVIYTGAIDELSKITESESHIEIGAGVSLTDVLPVIIHYYPDLEELLLRFASPPIRNAATLGGNIANGSPIGDSMPALMVMKTQLVLTSIDGHREVSLDDFYQDYMRKDLRPGEFVERVRVPLPEADVHLKSYKISKRFDQDISAVCAAYRLKIVQGQVESIGVAYGGMAATIRRAAKCEQAMAGKPWDEQTVQDGIAALAADFQPIGDMRATADYRLRVAQNLLRRLYLETTGELYETVYGYGRTA